MTFQEMVNTVSGRMNLSSNTALNRIGDSINERYKSILTSMGLETAARNTKTAVTTIGNRSLTFANTLKILSVFDNIDPTAPRVLDERTFDELRQIPSYSGIANTYAIQRMGANSVTIFFDATPDTVYTYTADIYERTQVLSGSQTPVFDENFHDILVYWAMNVEYDKMEKPDLAKEMENRSEARLSDYRLFIAKSAYLDIVQGGRARNQSLRGGSFTLIGP